MKIKILETIRQGLIGGGETHLLSLVENLDREKFDPVVLSFTDGPMVEQLTRMNVPVHVIATEKPFDILVWRKVKAFIEDQKVDVIHAHGTRAASNVLWSAKRLKIPIIYTVHGWSFHDDQNPLTKKIRISAEKYLTSKTDFNISVSASNRETGKKNFGEFESAVILNGVDRSKFNPEKKFADVRREFD